MYSYFSKTGTKQWSITGNFRKSSSKLSCFRLLTRVKPLFACKIKYDDDVSLIMTHISSSFQIKMFNTLASLGEGDPDGSSSYPCLTENTTSSAAHSKHHFLRLTSDETKSIRTCCVSCNLAPLAGGAVENRPGTKLSKNTSN